MSNKRTRYETESESGDDISDEEVRTPDEIKREKLIDHDHDNPDYELNKAISESIEEYNEYIKNIHSYEKQLIESIENEKKKRREICEPILFELKKLSKFDNEVKNIYDILDPVLESYMFQFIDKCEFDEETKNIIFNTLYKLRIKRENIEILKTIIL